MDIMALLLPYQPVESPNQALNLNKRGAWPWGIGKLSVSVVVYKLSASPFVRLA